MWDEVIGVLFLMSIMFSPVIVAGVLVARETWRNRRRG